MNYIKLMRSLKDKSYYSKDSEKLHLWVHLLLTANWNDREEMLGGKPIICKAGQFTTGRKQLSKETGINESKVERLLTYFEKTEQQIEQRKTNTNRLISILNWDKYQVIEQPSKQRVNNNRTTSEQRVNTPKEYKEDEEETKNKETREREKAPPKKENSIFEKFKNTLELDLDSCLKESIENQQWLETISMNNHLKSIEITKKYIDIFYKKLQNEGVVQKSLNDFKSHFARWLSLELKNKKNEKNWSIDTKEGQFDLLNAVAEGIARAEYK